MTIERSEPFIRMAAVADAQPIGAGSRPRIAALNFAVAVLAILIGGVGLLQALLAV
jgi:hypothetical protein